MIDSRALFLGLILALAMPAAAGAQVPAQAPAQGEQTAAPAKPAGAVGGWSASVAPDASTPKPGSPPDAPASQPNLTPEEAELVERLSAYFNSLEHLEGEFVQINPNNQTTKGKFYVQRPGLLRFDYAAPSRLRVIADGRYLSIEDHDLRTVDQYPLEATPFRLLLSEQVNLMRDAEIIDFSINGDIASLTLVDRSEGAHGKLQLFFTTGEIELKEWVITDPQGLDTRIQLSEVVAGNEKKKSFFKSSALDFQTFSQQ